MYDWDGPAGAGCRIKERVSRSRDSCRSTAHAVGDTIDGLQSLVEPRRNSLSDGLRPVACSERRNHSPPDEAVGTQYENPDHSGPSPTVEIAGVAWTD